MNAMHEKSVWTGCSTKNETMLSQVFRFIAYCISGFRQNPVHSGIVLT